ncbi:MAG: UbiA prenyltransferase family protein, partial [Methermicoccaceae archaeon]
MEDKELRSISLMAYLKLLRPEISDMDLALPASAALLASYIATGSFPDVGKFLLTVTGAYLAITSSYVLNDWYDVDIDKINLPHRPLVAGAITRHSAIIYATLLFGTAAVIAMYLNPESLIVLLVASGIITYYSSHAKRSTPLSFVPVGFAYGLVPAGVWLVFDPAGILKEDGGLMPLAGISLALMICITDWGFTLSGVSRDVVGDSKIGVPTLPVRRGIPFTSRAVSTFWLAGVILSLLIGYFGNLGPIYMVGATLAGIWMLLQCVDFIKNPVAERGGRLFLQGSRYRSVLFSLLIL